MTLLKSITSGILGATLLFSGLATAKTPSDYVNLIDIREKSEVNDGMVDGASWLAVSDIKNNTQRATIFFKKLEAKGTKTVNLYCRSGNRVRKITPVFEAKGYKVNNLGGFQGLKSKGLPSKAAALKDGDQNCKLLCL